MVRRIPYCLLPVVLAVAALGLVRTALAYSTEPRPPAAPSVTRNYPGSSPCNTTLQACINGSNAGDVINIQAGTYVTSVTINKSLTLVGAGTAPGNTILRGLPGQRVITVSLGVLGGVVISNLQVDGGSAASQGGGILAGVDSPLTLVNVHVLSNTAGSDGGGIVAGGGLTMRGGIVRHNVAGNFGGGIYAWGAVISATQIISNAATDGGGVYGATTGPAATPGLALTNTLVSQNRATRHGGGVYAAGTFTVTLGGTSSVSRTTLSQNTAGSNGGGVYANEGVQLLGYVSASNNTATAGQGGAIYADQVTNSTAIFGATVSFSSNNAGSHGGAIYSVGRVRLSGNTPTFTSNRAGGGTTADGGAIYAGGDVFLSLGRSQLNQARHGGAVYSLGNVFFNVHDLGPSANTSALDGGCAYAGQRVTFNSADAVGCVAGRNGGAAYATLTVTLSANGVGEFRLNRAASGGVAYAPTVEVRDTRQVISNTASLEGGAAFATKALHVTNSTLISNTARHRGGAAVVSGTAFITNSIFTTNRVTDSTGLGGALWVTGTASLSNTTFLTNTTPSGNARGGGLGATGSITLLGGAFQGNSAGNGGGVYGAGAVLAAGTVFTNNSNNSNASGGGLAAFTATLSSVVMTGNQVCCTGSRGGAVSATVAIISDSTFINNRAYYSGGAVLADRVLITASLFLSNTFSDEGAAVWTRNGAITNTVFTGNSTGCCSGRAGGAVYVFNNIVIRGSQFTRNESDRGGALFLRGGGALSEIYDSVFDGNFVDCCGGGGAIDAPGLGVIIENSTFTNNRLDCCDDGGAVRAFGYLGVVGSTFSGNQVDCCGDGGAIFTPDDNLVAVISASTFISNSASSSGGAISGGDLDVHNTTVLSNSAPIAGGGIHGQVGGSGVFIVGSTLAGNTAGSGGALECGEGCVISRTLFSGNSAFVLDGFTQSNVGTGGAVRAHRYLEIGRSRFTGNSAGAPGGGAIFFRPNTNTSLTVRNSLFDGNTASNSVFGATGAALIISGTSTAQVVHNTFAGPGFNNAPAVAVLSGTATLVNNIVTSHTVGIERQSGSVFENFNLFSGNGTNLSGTLTSGGSSFNGNPAFVSPLAGDYHLGVGSAAVDAATNAAVIEDYDGQARPRGAGFDIGFDEAYFIALGVSKSDGLTQVAPGAELTYTIVVTNAGPGAALGVVVHDTLPAGLSGATWTCVASAGSSCPASGSGDLDLSADLDVGGRITVTLRATVAPDAAGTLTNTASVVLPAYINTSSGLATDSTEVVAGHKVYLPLLQR